MHRARCADCDWIGDPQPAEQDAWADLRSHQRPRHVGRNQHSTAPRSPRCPAVLADEARRDARIRRANAGGITAEFPSVEWDALAWATVFDRYPHIYNRILDGMAEASTRWLAGSRPAWIPMHLVAANTRIDRDGGIR